VWRLPSADERGVCRQNCEITWERVPYLSTLQVCSRWGAIQIHVYHTLPYSELILSSSWNNMIILQLTYMDLCVLFCFIHQTLNIFASHLLICQFCHVTENTHGIGCWFVILRKLFLKCKSAETTMYEYKTNQVWLGLRFNLVVYTVSKCQLNEWLA